MDRTPCGLALGDLPSDLLGKVFEKLGMMMILSTVSLVCKRWAAAALACPELWSSAELVTTMDDHGLSRLRDFAAWLAQRASHVRTFHFVALGTGQEAEPQPGAEAAHRVEAWNLLQGVLAGLAPRLEKLDLQWHGGLPSMAWLLRLRSLQSLEVDAEWVEVDVPLAPLTHLTRMTFYTVSGRLDFREAADASPTSAAAAAIEPPPAAVAAAGVGGGGGGGAVGCPLNTPQQRANPVMLPPCLRNLSLLHATPVRLPACLHALTGLQRLYLSECVLEEGCYRTLGAATSLQHLAMHACSMPRLPHELSALTGLRALLLDNNQLHSQQQQQNDEDLAQLLAPLLRLEILGLSKCNLRVLPAVVTELTALRCLYTEENRLQQLQQGPYLRGLQLLSLDWRTLLGCGARLLSEATSLRQLYVCKPLPYLAALGDTTRSAALGAVCAALEAHPCLSHLFFVLYEFERLAQQVEVTKFMLRLARSCSRLCMGVIQYDQFYAANLDTLDDELEEPALESWL